MNQRGVLLDEQPSRALLDEVMISPLRELPPHIALQVVFFPPAGGGFVSFRTLVRPPRASLPQAFPDEWGLFGVQFDWKGWSFDTLVAALTDALEEHLPEAPRLFCGVSLGGMLAYEVACSCRQRQAGDLLGLAVAAISAPHLFTPHRRGDFEDWNLRQWRDEFAGLGGTSEDGLKNPDRLSPQVQRVLDSLSVAETFSYHDKPPLSYPLAAFGGERDKEFAPETIRAWRHHTTGPFVPFIYPEAKHLDLLTTGAARFRTDLISTAQAWLEELG